MSDPTRPIRYPPPRRPTVEEIEELRRRVRAHELAIGGNEHRARELYMYARQLLEWIDALVDERGTVTVTGNAAVAGVDGYTQTIPHVFAFGSVRILDLPVLPDNTIACSSDVYARLRAAFGTLPR